MGATVVRICVGVALGTLAALALLGRDGTQATSFNPQIQASLANPVAGASSDITLDFSIPAPDPNFDTEITFIPSAFHVAADADVPDGAVAGRLQAASTLGLFNGPCNASVQVTFELFEASTNTSNSLPLYAGFQDYDHDGLPDNVTHYPDFLNRIAPGLQPIQRLYGQQLVAGVETFVNFVIFAPGTAIPRVPAIDPSLGYSSMVFLNDPTAAPQASPITSFCTPLSTTLKDFGVSKDNPATAANEDGHQLLGNPGDPGMYTFTSFVRSRWDSDGDGIENKLDPCPYSADPGWDPRVAYSAADPDGNGIPSSCDPGGNSSADVDGDGMQNRFDNCPLVANPDQRDTDGDGIGDACDHFPLDATDGGTAHRGQVCVSASVQIGAGGSTPTPVVCPSGPDVPIPLVLSVYPQAASLKVSTVHSLAASIFDPLHGNGLPAATINFEITGANAITGSCVTNNGGSCEFNYVGANLGDDSILVTASANGQDLSQTATAEWLNPPANDNFADASPIDTLPFTADVPIAAAGRELNEPSGCSFGDSTVWFSFTSADDAYVRLEAKEESSAFAPVSIAVFENASLPQLQLVSCSYPVYGGNSIDSSSRPQGFGPPGASETYAFAGVQAGKTYSVQLSSYTGGVSGAISFTAEDAIRGDTNCDGVADASDVLGLLLFRSGFGRPPDCFGAGDFNCSGFVDIPDIMVILKIAAGVPVVTTACVLTNPGK